MAIWGGKGLSGSHCGQLQGGKVVPHDRGPIVATTRVVQPFARSLGGAETIGV